MEHTKNKLCLYLYMSPSLCIYYMHNYVIYLTVRGVILFCLPIPLALIYEPIVDLLQFKPTLFC